MKVEGNPGAENWVIFRKLIRKVEDLNLGSTAIVLSYKPDFPRSSNGNIHHRRVIARSGLISTTKFRYGEIMSLSSYGNLACSCLSVSFVYYTVCGVGIKLLSNLILRNTCHSPANSDTSELLKSGTQQYRKHNDEGDDQDQDYGYHHAFSRFLLQALCSLESICSPLHMVHGIRHLAVQGKNI